MATVIKIKRSETASDAPTTSDLVAGEVALNTADQIMYVRDSSGNIVKVSNSSPLNYDEEEHISNHYLDNYLHIDRIRKD